MLHQLIDGMMNGVNTIQVSPVTHFIVGGLAGATGTTLTFPLDVLKTHFQATERSILTSLATSASGSTPHLLSANHSSIYFQYCRYLQGGGFKVFFRGLSPALVGVVPARAVTLASYSVYKKWCQRVPYLQSNNNTTHFISGVLASVSMSVTTSPFWMVKTKMQLEHNTVKSAATTGYNIWKTNGIRGFYRGLSAACAGSLEKGVYFLVYEKLKAEAYSDQYPTQPLSTTNYLKASSIAAILSAPLCYPCEVVRTRMRKDCNQREYKTVLQSLLKIWRKERFTGMYGGMTSHLLKSVPATIITFLTYETIISLFYKY